MQYANRTPNHAGYPTHLWVDTELATSKICSLKLLKYACHVCPGTRILQLSHIQPLKPRVLQHRQTQREVTMQSHQTVRGAGTMSTEQRHLTLPRPTFPSAWKWRKYEIWIRLRCESATGGGRFLYVELVHWLIVRSPLANARCQGCNPKANTLNYWKSAQSSCCIILQKEYRERGNDWRFLKCKKKKKKSLCQLLRYLKIYI